MIPLYIHVPSPFRLSGRFNTTRLRTALLPSLDLGELTCLGAPTFKPLAAVTGR